MRYEYSGYLKSLLKAPDAGARDWLASIALTAEDIAKWSLADDDADKEWQRIPASIERTPEGILLRGHFEDVRRIDNVAKDDPSFWVALTSSKDRDPRFPIDALKYPMVEITYRCRTANAHPAWVWRYPGGHHLDGLQPSTEWRTVVRRVPYFGFPASIEQLTVRLYSTERTREAVEIQSIRFRAASPAEVEAMQSLELELAPLTPPPHYALLDEFMPAGVIMKGASSKRLAAMNDVSLQGYWRLAIEDIARHYHNCIFLEESDALTAAEFHDVLEIADSYGVRIVAHFDWLDDTFNEEIREKVDTYIRPYAGSNSILGWALKNEPPERTFGAHIAAREYIRQFDTKHPVVAMMRDPDAYGLFAPFFAASGMAWLKSHATWQMGPLIRTHSALMRGQQFWMMMPAFVHGTDTPEWSSCPEVRLMLNQLYANGGRGLFWFTYHNDPIWTGGDCQRSLTGPFLTFSDLWSELGLRMERFSAMAPMFLHATPVEHSDIDVQITWNRHSKAQLTKGYDSVSYCWLQGPDYSLLYVISNDIGEVTPVHIQAPDALPGGLEIHDMTDFARSRSWSPMERRRHIEMFPGQGQIIMIAPIEVCERWRDEIARRLIDGDRRQLAIDLELVRPYTSDISDIERRATDSHANTPGDLLRMLETRDRLLNLVYAAPALIEARSKIIEVSAAICGCDGSLCRLLGMGRFEPVHELGQQLIPLTQEMNRLRLQLREGKGGEISGACDDLAKRTVKLLHKIRLLT
jgi:hypothetical protein